jgi:hypothetical protein
MIINGCALTISKSHLNGLAIKVTVDVCVWVQVKPAATAAACLPCISGCLISSFCCLTSEFTGSSSHHSAGNRGTVNLFLQHIYCVCDTSGTYRGHIFLICSQDVLRCSSEQNSYHEFNILEDNQSKNVKILTFKDCLCRELKGFI